MRRPSDREYKRWVEKSFVPNFRQARRDCRRQKTVRSSKRKQNRQNRHHLMNKCRGGNTSPENILMLKTWKHDIWHRLFKNSDPEYIIAVLKRMCRMKGYVLHTDEQD